MFCLCRYRDGGNVNLGNQGVKPGGVLNIGDHLRVPLKFSIDRSLASGFSSPPDFADVTTTETLINDYLNTHWLQVALQGQTSNQAYFVNCDIASSTGNATPLPLLSSCIATAYSINI